MEANEIPSLRNPIDESSDCAREDYKALRDEVVMRIGKQQESATLALALIAALISLGVANGKSLGDFAREQYVFFPTISLLFVAFALTCLDHERNILDIYAFGKHVAMQRKTTAADLGTKRWVHFRAEQQQGDDAGGILASLGASAKYVIFLVPALLLTFSPFVAAAPFREWNAYFLITFVVDCLLLLMAVVIAIFNGRGYRRLAR